MATEYIYTYTEDDLASVAGAIRAKIYYNKKLVWPSEFVEKINNSAEVIKERKCVSKGLLEGTIASISDNSVKKVGYKAFYNCTSLTTVNFPVCTYIDSYAFQGCTTLTNVSLPNVETIMDNAFKGCSSLASLTLPCTTEIHDSAFIDCYSLKDLVLSNASNVCTLESANVLSNCYRITGEINSTYNSTGAKDGYIYVPDALVSDYKAATNWSNYASQIKPLSEHS